MTKVELFEAIRRDRYVQQKSVREIARDRGIHRRTVRQALESAVPPARKRVEREAPVLTAAMCQLIDAWLEGDREAPRKQRHTARRIWQRLRSEQDFRDGVRR
jgi:predicted transcriptional regulator